MYDNLTHSKKLLIFSEIIRILLSSFILYFLDIPIFVKIIFIMILDKLDCSHLSYPYTGPLLSKDTNICKTEFYQKSDKITDSICYMIILYYVINKANLSTKYNISLLLLLLHRLIGTVIFLINNDRKYLFYFPNFFLEICLGIMIMNYFPHIKKFEPSITIVIIIYKLLVEYHLHYKQNILP